MVLLLMGMVCVSSAQTLTPGAAAIGGTTTDAGLIAPSGNTINEVEGEQVQRTVHLPDPNWPLILPAKRGGSGQPVEATLAANAPSSTTGSAPQSPSSSTPNSQPDQSNTSTSSLGSGTQPSGAQTTVSGTTSSGAATPSNSTNQPVTENTGTSAAVQNDTTQVTAGATPETTPESNNAINATAPSTSTLSPLDGFDRAELNFGSVGVNLTAQHEISLDPVVQLMQLSPETPLRVVAVLAQAEASDEEVKLLARRRILAVRRYLIEQGLSADNLTFVIAANSNTEQFANYVLIER